MQRPLGQTYYRVLYFIYRHRFVTTYHIQILLGLRAIQPARRYLDRLYLEGYIGRHYDGSDRLQGRFAAYFLLPRGIASLRRYDMNQVLSEVVLKRTYKDRRATKQFRDHSVRVTDVWAAYVSCSSRNAGGPVTFLTRSDTTQLPELHPLEPDAYVAMSTPQTDSSRSFFMDVYQSETPLFVLRQKLRRYYEYVASGVWERARDGMTPDYVIICESKAATTKLQLQLARQISEAAELGVTVSFELTSS